MTVTTSEVRQIRDGAKSAHNVNIHRLGYLLEALADLAQMVIDGCDLDVGLTIPDVIEKAARVARDLCRDVPPVNPAP